MQYHWQSQHWWVAVSKHGINAKAPPTSHPPSSWPAQSPRWASPGLAGGRTADPHTPAPAASARLRLHGLSEVRLHGLASLLAWRTACSNTQAATSKQQQAAAQHGAGPDGMAVRLPSDPSPTARRDEQPRCFSPRVPSMMCLRDRPVALGALLPAGQGGTGHTPGGKEVTVRGFVGRAAACRAAQCQQAQPRLGSRLHSRAALLGRRRPAVMQPAARTAIPRHPA